MPYTHNKSHWWYVWIPIVSAFVWFGTLVALLATWLAQGGTSRRRYPSQDQNIAYISDVAADFLKPLFIVGCSITAVTFTISLAIERYLRHSGRLVPTMRRRETAFSILAVLSSMLGGGGLILLSIFDTKRYVHLHRVFLLLFMLGVALSALFTVIEYRWIAKDYRWLRQLRVAYLAKGLIAFVLVVLAVAFGVCLVTKLSAGAILEWIISFFFTFYLLTFYYDLRQAKGVRKNELNPQTMRTQRRWAAFRQR
ncbi:hypothetical protein MKEN_00324500 [Mycena kentingensis (nom. inval.)]|nr:hypothetical protein MKEN_00324500 [Mycena kentingensis (nom. inval.)]